MADLFWRQTKKPGRSASESSSNGSKPVKTPDSSSFTKFEDQTKDAWDCADDEVVNPEPLWVAVFCHFIETLFSANQNFWRGSGHLEKNGETSSNSV